MFLTLRTAVIPGRGTWREPQMQLHIGESRDDSCEIPGSCCAGPGMTEAIVRVGTLAPVDDGSDLSSSIWESPSRWTNQQARFMKARNGKQTLKRTD
jgi:hypothetical protein